MTDRLLTPEEMEEVANDAFSKDSLLEHFVATRGHWEEIAPIIAKAQDEKTLKALGEWAEKLLIVAEHGDYSNGNDDITGTDEGTVRAGECLDLFRKEVEALKEGRWPEEVGS